MPKSTKGYRVAIVNPDTLAGNELKMILHERGLLFASIYLLDSTGENEGKLTEIGDEAAVLQEITTDALDDLDIVFFCGSADANAKWIAQADERQFLAIDLSRPAGQQAGSPPIVAGVNTEALSRETGVVTAPHPASIPLALILDRLRELSPIRLAIATIVQPASEFGREGVDELFQQTIQSLNMQSIAHDVFDRQVAFNLYPAKNASAEESHIRADMRAILGEVPVTVALLQGPTFHGHSLSIFIQTESPLDLETVRSAFESGSEIELEDDGEPASTIDAGAKDSVLVGAIERDSAVPGGIWIWAVSDNLRRGAGLNAVLIAEAVMGGRQWTN